MKLLCIALLLFVLACSDSPNIAGGSTSVENGFVIITASFEGNPVSTEIQLIPSDYDPTTHGLIRSQMSDSLGKVRFDSVPKGDYSIVILFDSIGVYQSGITINDSASVTLTKTGTLKIKADASTEARLLGSPFLGEFSAEDSTIRFANIPAGIYPELKISGSITGSADSVRVLSDQTVLIESGELALSIMKMPLDPTLESAEIISISVDAAGKSWIAAGTDGYWYNTTQTTWGAFKLPAPLLTTDTILTVRVSSKAVKGSVGNVHLLVTSIGPILSEYLGDIDGNPTSPVVNGNAITASTVNYLGTSAFCSDTSVWFRKFGVQWEEVTFTGSKSLHCSIDTLWVGTKTGSVVAVDLNTKAVTSFTVGSNSVDAVLEIDNQIYAGTQDGLFLKNGTTFEKIIGTPDSIRQIVQDSSGVIWAISGSSSLMKYNGKTVETFAPMNGSLNIREICGSRDGVTSACGNQGVFRFW